MFRDSWSTAPRLAVLVETLKSKAIRLVAVAYPISWLRFVSMAGG